jgi:hypothetical protein
MSSGLVSGLSYTGTRACVSLSRPQASCDHELSNVVGVIIHLPLHRVSKPPNSTRSTRFHSSLRQALTVVEPDNPDLHDLHLQTIHSATITRASRSLATTLPSSRPTSAVSHHHWHFVVRLQLPLVLPAVAPVLVVVPVLVSVKSVSSDQDVPPPQKPMTRRKMSWPGRGRRYVSGHAALLCFSGYCYRWWWWSSGLLVMVYCQVVCANGAVFHGKAYCSQSPSWDVLAPSCLSYPSDLLLLHPSLHDPHSQHHPRSDRGK